MAIRILLSRKLGEKTINAIYHLMNDCNWDKDKKIAAAKKALAQVFCTITRLKGELVVWSIVLENFGPDAKANEQKREISKEANTKE